MKIRSATNQRRSIGEQGGALVITLSIVVLVVIVLLASLMSSQLSQQLSRSRLDSASAHQFAVNGIENAVALLRLGTGTGTLDWISMPGRIVLFPGGEPEFIHLHSGIAENGGGANLNASETPDSSIGLLTGSVDDRMTLEWIYVRSNGSVTTTPSYSATNPIIGRYAFWVDDEATRINLNTAFLGRATSDDEDENGAPDNRAPSDPSLVSLEAVDFSMEDAVLLRTFRNNAGFFDSVQSVLDLPLDGGLANLRNHRFNVTHYNHSPEYLTPWGEPRIVLTTRRELAVDPATGQQLPFINLEDSDSIQETIALLNAYLGRDDWPAATGQDFTAKYPADRRLQIALNIIDYVRAAETPVDGGNQGIVTPIWATESGESDTNFTYSTHHRGISRGPKITELAVWRPYDVAQGDLDDPGSDPRWDLQIFVEIYLPENSGLESVNLRDLFYLRQWGQSPAAGNLTDTNSFTQSGIQIYTPDGGDVLRAGQRGVVSQTRRIPATVGPTGTATYLPANVDTLWTRYGIALADNRSRIIDLVPLQGGNTNRHHRGMFPPVNPPNIPPNERTLIGIPVTVGPEGVTDISMQDAFSVLDSIEIDDPALNGRQDQWVRLPGNTFGSPPAGSATALGQEATMSAWEQDVGGTGNITNVGLAFPPPAGTPGNPRGRVESLAELGRIHTGVGSMNISPTGNATTPIPWKSLRLQPRGQGANLNHPPDWVLLDAFALPIDPDTTPPPEHPAPFAAGGRINLHTLVSDFDLDRRRALEAVLEGIPGISADNFRDRILTYLEDEDGPGYLRQIGELVEIPGIADGGEADEATLRQILDLFTVRSNVFGVYSIGQSVLQTPDGSINVRGEERLCSVVERLDVPGSTPRFRSVFTKSLGR